MISALNFRLTRVALVAVGLVNVFIIFIVFDHVYNFSKIDYSTLKTIKTWQGAGNATGINRTGYQLEPGNVQFKFINPMRKKGTPDEILSKNEATYSTFFEDEIKEPKDIDIETIRPPKDINSYEHANATIIVLVRNSEIIRIGKTIRSFEKTFNKKFKYPYTFINDEPFTQRFQDKMRAYSDAPMNFVVVSPELWDQPAHIDKNKQLTLMRKLHNQNIAYALKKSYHNMCRFYSGNFYNVPELQKYKYYWRIEPDVKFYTDLQYDVFKYLEYTKKVYGFTISLYDIDKTIETLWPETLNFLNKGDNYKYVNRNGAFQWLLEDQQNPDKNVVAGGYSTCHFWSNFEIGDMDFFRTEAYTEWFKHLDQTGGFYYERWGDAPVHSVGLALFADKSKIHWFRDIGYFHDPYINCPNNPLTKGCATGKFSRWKHLADQNCMGSWIDYSMDDKARKIY